jgi:hypothetical protein
MSGMESLGAAGYYFVADMVVGIMCQPLAPRRRTPLHDEKPGVSRLPISLTTPFFLSRSFTITVMRLTIHQLCGY